MTQAKHTPGDWQFDAGDLGDSSVGVGAVAPSVVVETQEGYVVEICRLTEPVYREDRAPRDDFDECLVQLGDLGANGLPIAVGKL